MMAVTETMVREAFDCWVQHLAASGYTHCGYAFYEPFSPGSVPYLPLSFSAESYCLVEPGVFDDMWHLYLSNPVSSVPVGLGDRWVVQARDHLVPATFETNRQARNWFLNACSKNAETVSEKT